MILLKEWPTVSFGRLGLFSFRSVFASVLWEQWFGRKHEWLLSERRELMHVRVTVCVWVRARVCVISSWVAGCRQPGRDKRGWMEGALRVCVCVCVHVCVHVGKSLHKGLEVCVLLSTSAGLGGDKQTAKYSPCVFPAKTGGGIPTTQTDATGSGLEWATRRVLKNKASVMVSVALSLC